MKARDVVIGLVILVVVITAALIIKNKKNAVANLPLPTPNFASVENKFPTLSVPANADRASLTNVSSGSANGEAFKTFENGKFSLTVLADLPAPTSGYFYQGWLVRGNPGDTDFAYVSLGKLALSKGGYISELSVFKDYSDYKKVVVSLEKVYDATPEQHILEGSF